MDNLSLFEQSGFENFTPRTAGPKGSDVRVRLTIAYDGTDFRGLAPNPGVRTVVGELQRVLADALGFVPVIVMSGRTDAGVHAAEQVLSLDLPEESASSNGLERMAKMLNSRLAPEIVTLEVVTTAAEFSARFDATGRSYRYLIVNRPNANPTLARYAWHVAEPLNLSLMRLACDPLVGTHDFSSFCRRPKRGSDEPSASLVRRVTAMSWAAKDGDLVEFNISGSAFCHQMVRSIVGFHVAVGRGKRSAGELRGVLAARDRHQAEPPAPPHGLHLLAVSY